MAGEWEASLTSSRSRPNTAFGFDVVEPSSSVTYVSNVSVGASERRQMELFFNYNNKPQIFIHEKKYR